MDIVIALTGNVLQRLQIVAGSEKGMYNRDKKQDASNNNREEYP
jgi:hypothetical protein